MQRKVLITGVSGNIGYEIANCFLKNGWNVYGTYFSKKIKIPNKYKDRFTLIKLDIGNKTSINELVQNIEGRINALVNNAGINIPNDFNKINLSDWDEIFSVNVKGVFYLTQQLEFKICDSGSIVNIASFSGQVGGPRTTHYAASKAALIALTQNMARYFSPRLIRVNAVSPGIIESELANAAKKLPIINDILLKRLGKPKEVADTVVFLASDESSYITAQTINVNGGLYF
jgi:3-oxoacyl-[acyl-carrier protein] reductase